MSTTNYRLSYDLLSINTNHPTGDAFGRLRTSGTGNRLDVEFLYNKQIDFFDEVTNNGIVAFNTASRDLTLSLTDANNDSYALMSSYPVPYTPGNSQLIEMTGVLDNAGLGNGVAEVFLRSNVTGSVIEHSIEQTEWKSNTEGVSWSASHIFAMDFQSLRVGRIRFYLIQNGVHRFISEIFNDNIRNTGFWQTASLPAFWKVYTTGGNTYMELGYGDSSNAIGFRYVVPANATASMKAICCTVKSEDGVSLSNIPGMPRSVSNEEAKITVSTTLIPVLSIRPRTTFNSLSNLAMALPKSFSFSTNNPVRVAIIHGGALTDPVWADVDTNYSMMEYDFSASAITGGRVLDNLYIETTQTNRGDDVQGILGKGVLWNRLGSETGIFTVAAIKTSTNDGTCLAAINWDEIK